MNDDMVQYLQQKLRPFPKQNKVLLGSLLCQRLTLDRNSNVEDNCDVTKPSLSSIPSVKVRGHFENVFVRRSAVLVSLTFLLIFTAQKETIRNNFSF